jgi:hypothetical protein
VQNEDAELKKLVHLIRNVAREVAYEIMDEHLDDCEHKEKPIPDDEEN